MGTSFNELAQMICEEAGYKPTFNHIITKPTGVSYRVGDHELSHQYFIPQITLREGIRRALAERK
jgi:nucleoside-diphosphate-sugar epimerase